jgi:phage baseplate assembly protein W
MSKLQGISPQLPLSYSETDGPYRLNKTLTQTIRQNFKNLILTSPGERIMEPNFGVGLYNFLFEPLSGETMDRLVEKITEQKDVYMPSVNIEVIDFVTSDENSNLAYNQVQVVIQYNILPYNAKDELRITSTMAN